MRRLPQLHGEVKGSLQVGVGEEDVVWDPADDFALALVDLALAPAGLCDPLSVRRSLADSGAPLNTIGKAKI